MFGRLLQQLAFVVAPDRRQVQRHQPVRRFHREQAAGTDVAQIDDPVRPAIGGIGQHRVERGDVAMNVGKDGDLHRGTLGASRHGGKCRRLLPPSTGRAARLLVRDGLLFVAVEQHDRSVFAVDGANRQAELQG